MKKLLCCLFAAVVLAGCGGGGNASKTCSTEQEGLEMKMTAEAPSNDADVEKVTLTVKGGYDDLGLTKEDLEASGMEDMLLSGMEEMVLSSFNVEKGEGVEVTTNEFTDSGYELELTLDIVAMADALGVDPEKEDLSLISFVEAMEDAGMDCE